METTSEVARVRQAIEQEYAAMVQGLSGIAQGQARHAFIEARQHRIDEQHQRLTTLIGPEEAIALVFDIHCAHC